MNNNENNSEYGSSSNVRFLNMSLCDSNGNEIETPVCESCKCKKSLIIGSNSSAFICIKGCPQ